MQIEKERLYEMIGTRVRSRRMLGHLTQSQLAQAVGVLRTTISNIESGRQQAPLDVLYNICAVLKCDIGALLPSVGELTQVSTVLMDIDGITHQLPPRTAQFVKQLLEE